MIEGKNLILRIPTKSDKQEILNMVQEFKNHGEEVIAGAGGVENCSTYEEWLNKNLVYSQKETVPKNKVVSTQFISVRKEDNKIIGFIQLRHELNDFLATFGGHIGDSVRPLERRKGYATEQLILCSKYAKQLGIDKLLITCKDWNIGSKKSIIKSGGKFENTKTDDSGNVMERYWINLI